MFLTGYFSLIRDGTGISRQKVLFKFPPALIIASLGNGLFYDCVCVLVSVCLFGYDCVFMYDLGIGLTASKCMYMLCIINDVFLPGVTRVIVRRTRR